MPRPRGRGAAAAASANQMIDWRPRLGPAGGSSLILRRRLLDSTTDVEISRAGSGGPATGSGRPGAHSDLFALSFSRRPFGLGGKPSQQFDGVGPESAATDK